MEYYIMVITWAYNAGWIKPSKKSWISSINGDVKVI